MSRRTSRRHQQALNEWRRTGQWVRLWDLGIPYSPRPGVWMVPADPVREREELVRQLMARAPDIEGPSQPLYRGEVGHLQGIVIIGSVGPNG